MATTKITDLTAYTDPVNTDVLPIVDVTSDVTKKVSIANVMKNASLGSAAAPGISFDGDPNTGIYSPGANQVAISTDGTARLTAGTTAITAAIPVDVLLGSASTPSYTFTGDLNTGIYSPGADQVAISTNGTGRLFVDSSGKVGAGTAVPGSFNSAANQLVIGTGSGNQGATLYAGSTGESSLFFADSVGGSQGQIFYRHSNDSFGFVTNNGSASLNIDSSGRVGLGTSTLRQVAGATANLQNERTGAGGGAALSLLTNSSSGVASQLTLGASRGAAGTPTSVLSTDVVGTINFFGADGTDYDKIVASVRARALGTITSDRVPGQLEFYTAENDTGSTLTQRLTIDNQGRVGVGTTSPAANLDVAGAGTQTIRSITTDVSGSAIGRLRAFYTGGGGGTQTAIDLRAGDGYGYLLAESNVPLLLGTNNTERARIDSSGRLLVGTSTARSNFFNSTVSASFQVEGAGISDRGIAVVSGSTEAGRGGMLILAHQKSGSTGGNTILSSGDQIGLLTFQGSDGSEFVDSARIAAEVDGTPGANDMPGRLVFSTTADGASSPTERLRIDSSGRVGIGTTTVSAKAHIAGAYNEDGLRVFSGSSGYNPPVIIGNSSGTEYCRVDGAGRLLVGTTSSIRTDGVIQGYKASGQTEIYVRSGSLANDQNAAFSVMGTVSGGGDRVAAIQVSKHSGISSGGANVFLEDASTGTGNFIWPDSSGVLRISTTYTNVGTTGGTVVGSQTSDERVKNILGPVEYGLNTVKQIEPVRYSLKSRPETEQIGFIAQQVQPLIPQVVFDTKEHIEGEPEDAPTKLGMEYVALIPVLVNAIKELSAEVDALKAQLS